MYVVFVYFNCQISLVNCHRSLLNIYSLTDQFIYSIFGITALGCAVGFAGNFFIGFVIIGFVIVGFVIIGFLVAGIFLIATGLFIFTGTVFTGAEIISGTGAAMVSRARHQGRRDRRSWCGAGCVGPRARRAGLVTA